MFCNAPIDPSSAPPPLCRLHLYTLGAILLCLTGSGVCATPADAVPASRIPELISQLGNSAAADAVTVEELRPLIARYRVAGPDRASVAGMPEEAWLGTLETLWVDKQDTQGNQLVTLAQRILHSGADALRVYSLQGELETVADGVPVIITGYRVDKRVLVTAVSLPPAGSLP